MNSTDLMAVLALLAGLLRAGLAMSGYRNERLGMIVTFGSVALAAVFVAWKCAQGFFPQLARESVPTVDWTAWVAIAAALVFVCLTEVIRRRRAYTDRGFSWERIGGSSEPGNGLHPDIVNLKPFDDLPQPLHLRVECSHIPKTFAVTFYEDKRTLKQRNASTSEHLRGKKIDIVLEEPKLVAPAFLSIIVSAKELIRVMRITRRRR